MVVWMRSEAEAVPRFGYDDAVGRVVEVVADLDGEIGPDIEDVIGKQGDILGALIGDASDAVVVDQNQRSCDCVVLRRGNLGDAAVGDPSSDGKKIAAFPFDLFDARFGAS